MKDGMSVQEIYEAIDQLVRLKEAFGEQRSKCEELNRVIIKSISYNSTTAETYKRVAALSRDDAEKAEFLGKAAGLLEASRMLKQYMEGDKNVQ